MMLNDEDIRRLDDRYVSKAECEIKNDKTQADISRMTTDLAVLRTLQEKSNKLQGVIATATISGIVGLIIAAIVWAIKQGAV